MTRTTCAEISARARFWRALSCSRKSPRPDAIAASRRSKTHFRSERFRTRRLKFCTPTYLNRWTSSGRRPIYRFRLVKDGRCGHFGGATGKARMSLSESERVAVDFERLVQQHNAAPEITDEPLFFELLEALPAAIYVTDSKGRITYYNKAAAELWGRRPVLGDAEWCGSWKLFWPDGTPLPHSQCPMAIA